MLPLQRRLPPVLSLMFLTPLIAEYLLGNLPVSKLSYMLGLTPLYGAGALFIRELVRRTGRGWPSLILLGLGYGLLEEGVVTQSLFNPNYMHLRLLDYGFVPVLGVGAPWAVYVVILHVVWSIAVPIGLVEALFPAQRTTPWLKGLGFGLISVVFASGAVLLALMTLRNHGSIATPAQLGGVGVLIAALSAAAFLAPQRASPSASETRSAPPPLALGVIAFVTGSVFHLANANGPGRWPATVTVLAMLTAAGGFFAFLAWAGRGRVWRDSQRWALTAGAVMVYVWLGFMVDARLNGAGDLPAHAVLVVAMLMLTALAGWRSRKGAAYHS